MAQPASPDQDHIPPEGSSLPPLPSSTSPTTLPTNTGPPSAATAASVTTAPTSASTSADASLDTSTSPANAVLPPTTSTTGPSSAPPSTAQNGESTATSAEMSDGLPRPPIGYHSPAATTAYAPASMAPTAHYPYQPVPSSQPADQYRPNPPAVGSNNGLSLPGVRTLDQMHQQPQQHMTLAAPISVPSTVPSMYYPQPGMAIGHGTYGYALGPGLLGAGRPKKEIKRRTKTGCLTCRKRRIKCDEGHPTCNNCRKSKRDCLGYDPLFKQQQVPAAIQPAPNSQQAPSQQSAARPPPAPTTLPSNTPPEYTSQHHPVLSSSAATAVDPDLPPVPPGVQPLPVKSEPGEFPVIDPALQGSVGPSQFQQSQVKGGNLSFSPVQQSARVGADYSGQAKMEAVAKVRFDSLVDTLQPESICPLPTAPADVDELQRTFDQYYTQLYCPALVTFWESRWFEANRPSLHADLYLRHLFKAFWSSFQPAYSDPSHSGILEAMLIWAISKLSLATPEGRNADGALVPKTDATEIRNRVKVYDALMSGDYLEANPLVQPPALTQNHPEYHHIRQFQFWHGLAQLLTIKPGPTQEAQQGAALNEIRYILDGRENRDVIYSIALARVYGARVDYSQVSANDYKDENDPRHKLAVAVKFIQTEAHPSGGTNCAVRRFSEYARQAFIDRRSNCERPAAAAPVPVASQ